MQRFRSKLAASLSCLALGALTTTAIAWVLAARLTFSAGPEWSAKDQSFPSGEWAVRRWHPPPMLSGSLPAPDPFPPAVRLVLSWWGQNDLRQADHVAFDTLTMVGRTRIAREQSRWQSLLATTPGASIQYPFLVWDARGWPRPALSYEWRSDGKRPETLTLSGGIALSPDPSTTFPTHMVRALPLVPIWPGFAVDTALWSAAWGVLLLSPSFVRMTVRSRRRVRGLCPRCGYDRSGLAAAAPCPECGAAG